MSTVGNSSNTEDRLWFGFDVNAERAGLPNTNHVQREPQNELDKDAFLRLLLVSMQYQDPLNPTDDRQFIAQMAQLTVAEQMQNMARSFAHTQAYAMLGKSIFAEIIDENTNMVEEVFGMVTAVIMRNGEAILLVGETEVPVNRVRMVISDNLADSINNLTMNTITGQALSLIGKRVQAIVLDRDGNPQEFVEGVVDNVKFDARGNPLLVIGNHEVFPREVIAIGAADQEMLVGRNLVAYYAPTIGSAVRRVVGRVTGVRIDEGQTFLQIRSPDTTIPGENEGDASQTTPGSTHEVFVRSVALVTDALRHIDRPISHEGVSGTVSGVVIRNGIPFVTVGTQEINFASFRNMRFDDVQAPDE